MPQFLHWVWDKLNSPFVETLISTIFGGLIVLYFTERSRKGKLFIELPREVIFYSSIITAYGRSQDTYKKNNPHSVMSSIDFILDIYNSSQDEKIIKQAKLIIEKSPESHVIRIEHAENRFFTSYTFPPKHLTQLKLNCEVDRDYDIESYSIWFRYKDEKNKVHKILLYSPSKLN